MQDFLFLHSPLIHVMLGVVEPHANLDGVALPDPLEDVLHGLAFKGLSDSHFPLENVSGSGLVSCYIVNRP